MSSFYGWYCICLFVFLASLWLSFCLHYYLTFVSNSKFEHSEACFEFIPSKGFLNFKVFFKSKEILKTSLRAFMNCTLQWNSETWTSKEFNVSIHFSLSFKGFSLSYYLTYSFLTLLTLAFDNVGLVLLLSCSIREAIKRST